MRPDSSGQNILGTGFNFALKTIKGAGAYICGEETALLASIEGQRPRSAHASALPHHRGPLPQADHRQQRRDLREPPRHPHARRQGYATIGTPQSTGPKLLSLDSHFVKPGIYEVAMGTPLQTVIDLAAASKRRSRPFRSAVRSAASFPMSHIASSPSISRASRKPASSSATPASSASPSRCR
jgi:NADH:ubiquinone oxidoreductase subunit F (NADH-binding)